MSASNGMTAPSAGWRDWGVEAAVASLACVVFFACLGSLELWGKREQRVAAEVLDTLGGDHWLVAQIQGRPRLEKPPLPRWTTAVLAKVVGRLDETILRLPGALAALGTVALTYLLGCRLGGPPLGRTAAIILCTTPLFIAEARQAGQDVPLALFTILAIYAAIQQLDPATRFSRRWALIFHAALGLGFLCKGPVILGVVAAALVPTVMTSGAARKLVRLATYPPGVLVSLGIALSWPLPVWLSDPNAAGVWAAEIGQKTGAVAITHRERTSFLIQWPALILPWVVAGGAGLALPFRRRGDAEAWLWIPWSWSIGVAMLLGLWAVAKPNYYVPCLPGFALMAGAGWLWLCRRAFGLESRRSARVLVYLQWIVWSVIGAGALAIAGRALGASVPIWSGVMSAAAAGAGVLGAVANRRGWGESAMTPALIATAVAVVIGYGVVAPAGNSTRGHRDVAAAIDRAVPAEDVLSYFHEVDEGLWFYLRSRRLEPVPGSQPRYNDAYDQIAGADGEGLGNRGLVARSKKLLAEWLRSDARPGMHLLFREKVYLALAAELDGVATLVLREEAMDRNGLVLLRLDGLPERTVQADPGPSPL